MLAFCDCEADALLFDASVVWCIVSKIGNEHHIYLHHDLEGKPNKHTYYYNIEEYFEQVLYKVGHLVFHNGINYDLPLLAKLHNFQYNISPDNITDTHILSRLYNSDREGHSLEWFGEKLRFKKGTHSDFSKLSLEMLEYCIQDVAVLERVYNLLQAEAEGWDWSEAIKLEYEIWHVQMKQEMKGVLFNVDKAEKLLDAIETEIKELEHIIIEEIPMNVKDEGEVKKVFLKNGNYTQSVIAWLEGV